MLRRSMVAVFAIGFGSQALACTIEDRAALKGFGCSDIQIEKRCQKAGVAAKQSVATLRAVKRPNQGVLSASGGSRLAPFRITTPNDGGYYFLKLVQPASKKAAVMSIFMNGGSTYETKVPLGSYVLRYASGSEWYGTTHLFGPCKTNFFEAQTVLTFSRSGNQLLGHRVELIKQVGGNLSTTGVDEDEF